MLSSVCMEDVVLHYRPGSAVGLSSLLQRAEKLLETFPFRTPPVFSPWFPTAADRHLPIRPAKPAPIITCSCEVTGPDPGTAQNRLPQPQTHENPRAESTTLPHDGLSETSTCLLPTSLFHNMSPKSHTGGVAVADRPLSRSWSVFTHRGVLQSSQPLSKQFRHMVSVHRLHLYQRVKWVIGQHSCGTSGDIEQVSITRIGSRASSSTQLYMSWVLKHGAASRGRQKAGREEREMCNGAPVNMLTC